MKPLHFLHWTNKERSALESCQSFTDLTKIALTIVERHGNGINMISGPISTGGTGNRKDNIKIFQGAIEYLYEDCNLKVLSQVPFEDKIEELWDVWKKENPKENYCVPVLEEFYEGIFSSGKVEALHFIHGYESSRGACWEHNNCNRWGIKRVYLNQNVSKILLERINNKKI